MTRDRGSLQRGLGAGASAVDPVGVKRGKERIALRLLMVIQTNLFLTSMKSVRKLTQALLKFPLWLGMKNRPIALVMRCLHIWNWIFFSGEDPCYCELLNFCLFVVNEEPGSFTQKNSNWLILVIL